MKLRGERVRRVVIKALFWVVILFAGAGLVRAVEDDLLLLERLAELQGEAGELSRALSALEARSPRQVYAFDARGYRVPVHSLEDGVITPSYWTVLLGRDGELALANYSRRWWPAYNGAIGVLAFTGPQCTGQRYFCPGTALALGRPIVFATTTEPVAYEMYLLTDASEARTVVPASYQNLSASPDCIEGSVADIQDVCFPLPDEPNFRDSDLEMVLPVTFGVLR